jgi:hypothetical protein
MVCVTTCTFLVVFCLVVKQQQRKGEIQYFQYPPSAITFSHQAFMVNGKQPWR